MVELTDKLASLGQSLTDAEKANYKLILGLACSGLLAQRTESAAKQALDVTMASLADLQPYRRRIPPTGIVYRGRPDFMSDDLLRSLQRESLAARASARRFDDHFVSPGGPTARQVAFSEQLLELVRAGAGSVVSTGRTNYLYYDEPGLGIDPHIDNEEFPLNTILMLEHQRCADPSALALFREGQAVERIFLAPGELIVFFADSVVHARERMKQEEKVRIVAFGFQPVQRERDHG